LRAELQWLETHDRGKIYVTAVLAALARRADEALAAAPESDRRARRTEALEAYRRLSRMLGNTPASIRANKNSRIACLRVAQHAFDLDQPELAAQPLDTILEAYPDDAEYLRRAGLAHFRARHFARALEIWRTLLAGLPAGSEGWCEAKYQQICCLAEIDAPRARSVLNQFQTIYPELGPGRWPGEFRLLANRLRSAGSAEKEP
jgi:tetratricopeptide (TPR) repeat protein